MTEKKPSVVFLYRGGGEVAQTYTNGLRPFDFVLHGDGEGHIDLKREVVPLDLVADYCRWQVSHMTESLKYVRAVTDLPVYQIGMPPITPSANYIISQAHDGHRDELKKTGIAPFQFRHKIWKMLVRAQRELCATNGIVLVEPPTSTLDEHECLLEEYWGDGIHANEKYGMVLLDSIIALAREHHLGKRT